MKIIVASDSYKGCLSSLEVANIMEQAIRDVDSSIEVCKVSIADGGEGFVEAMVHACNGRIRSCRCVDSMLNAITTEYGVIYNDTAVIEVAKVVPLIKRKGVTLHPEKCSSFGVGLLIKEAIAQGYRKLIIGLGGSCTNDGGMGLLNALGVNFYDNCGSKLYPKAENLQYIDSIDTSYMIDLHGIEVTVACDVKNPLLGPNGATYIFGPQKGVSEYLLPSLERGMQNYRDKVYDYLSVDLDSFVGGGAAGGMGAVLFGFLEAKMQMGIEVVLNAVKFDEMLVSANYVFTGEGQTDAQSLQGKAVFGILKHANKFDVPVLCVSGALKDGYQKLYDYGVCGCYSIINCPMAYPQAFQLARRNLYNTTYSLVKTLCAKRG